MWQWKQTCSDIGSQVKKCGQMLEAGKAKGTEYSIELPEVI